MKQTEIGLIPDDWEVKEISSIKDKLVVGFVGTCEKYYTTPANGIVMLRTGDLKESYIDFSNTKYVTKEFHTNNRKSQLHKNDILIARHGSNGHGVLFESNINANSLNIVIFHPDEKQANPKYTVYQLDSTLVKNQVNSFSAGSTQEVINTSQIAKLKIPLPSTLAEQQRIAKALSDVDALISTTEKLIQKKKNIKQGAMQELLTGKKRLPGFCPQTKTPTYKQTELGPIPDDWEVKKLSSFTTLITKGTTPTSIGDNFTDGGIKFIKIESLTTDFKIDLSKITYISESTHKKLYRSELKRNDLLISIAGALGKTTIVESNVLPANTNQALAIVRLADNNLLDVHFLLYWINSNIIQAMIKDMSVTGAQPNISLKNVNDLPIIIPPKEEQTAIANVLSSMDKEIETLNTKLEKYRNLKTAMMQQLLTGKIRLK